jgi:hypothetical protein
MKVSGRQFKKPNVAIEEQVLKKVDSLIDQTDLGSVKEYDIERSVRTRKSKRDSIRVSFGENFKELLTPQQDNQEGTFSSSVFSRNHCAVSPRLNRSHIPLMSKLMIPNANKSSLYVKKFNSIVSAPTSQKNSARLMPNDIKGRMKHLKNKIEQISSFHNTVRLTE